jgi:hypothetical protein
LAIRYLESSCDFYLYYYFYLVWLFLYFLHFVIFIFKKSRKIFLVN